MIIQEIKERADEYNLTNEFNELIRRIFLHEKPLQAKRTKQRTTTRGNTTASVS